MIFDPSGNHFARPGGQSYHFRTALRFAADQRSHWQMAKSGEPLQPCWLNQAPF
jgi:hypothetical protein